MKPIHICVPVLKRYDLLRDMLVSLNRSTVRPQAVYVVDNGRDPARCATAVAAADFPHMVYRPDVPLGVAESWNWFIRNVPEERVIANDDLTFAPDSLALLLAPKASLIWAEGCGFSCFVIRDACVRELGLFDETISPGYGYYEDEDYLQRLDGRGTRAPAVPTADVACDVVHRRSSTMEWNTPAEMQDHHRRFSIAKANYMRKWGLRSL